MDITNNTTISKLIMLYVFDKMEMPLTEATLLDMCCFKNNWVNYITCKEILNDLIDTGFIVPSKSATTDSYFTITNDGRSCLSYFFIKIPASLRDEITKFVKENRIAFRRKQEYFADYFKNDDGTYTVLMKIIEPLGTKLELKLNVANRAQARSIYKKWENSAGQVYASLYDILMD